MYGNILVASIHDPYLNATNISENTLRINFSNSSAGSIPVSYPET